MPKKRCKKGAHYLSPDWPEVQRNLKYIPPKASSNVNLDNCQLRDATNRYQKCLESNFSVSIQACHPQGPGLLELGLSLHIDFHVVKYRVVVPALEGVTWESRTCPPLAGLLPVVKFAHVHISFVKRTLFWLKPWES